MHFISRTWKEPRKNYYTIKKEILVIVLSFSKFQEDLLNKKVLLRIEFKLAKEVLENKIKNLASKQIFARWKTIPSMFDFIIEFIKEETNSFPDFLTK